LKYIFRRTALVYYFINNAAFGVNWGIKGMLWPLIIFSIVGRDVIAGSVFATMGMVAFVVLLLVGKLVDKRPEKNLWFFLRSNL